MSSTTEQLQASVDALALAVSTLGDCDCDVDESLPCEQHSTTLAQYAGSSSRSADQLVSVVLDELVTLACLSQDPAVHAAHNDVVACAAVVLDEDDARTRLDFGRALDELDTFTSWIDDRDLADAARGICDELESEMPETYGSQWDDGWSLWRITGGPLAADPETVETFTDEDALEVYATARLDFSGVSVESVTIVTGTGGPHIEAVISGDRATVSGYWGSDTIVRHVETSAALSAWVEQYADSLGSLYSAPQS